MVRRWWALLAGCVLAMSTLGAVEVAAPPASEAGAQARTTTRLTLAVSTPEAAYAARVTLSGRLTAGGRGVNRQKVVLRHATGTATTYAKVATATTNRKGVWKKVVEVRSRGSWIATYRGNATYAGSKAARRTIDVFAPLTDYTVSPGDRDAYLGEVWTFVARTAPELAGRSVSLVRGPNRAPTKVTSATIGPGGAIAVAHPMTVAGQQEYWLSVDSSSLMFGADSPHTVVRTRSTGAPTTPTIATSALPSVEEHLPYQANLVGGGGELTWSLAAGTLPPGLTLAADGTISGSAPPAGSYAFAVRAANPAGSALATVSLTSSPGVLAVTTWRLEDTAVGVPYPEGSYTSYGEQPLTCTPCASGGTWRITSGTLPPGLALDHDDFLEESYIYGQATQAGTFTFTVTVASDGHSGSRTYSIRVEPTTATLLRIDYDRLSESIDPATVGQSYAYQLTAGGASGLTWTSLGTLPPGLSLSPGGLLSGTPTAAGSGWIYVGVTDGTRYDWQGLMVTVHPAP
jgi:hypothetical protein